MPLRSRPQVHIVVPALLWKCRKRTGRKEVEFELLVDSSKLDTDPRTIKNASRTALNAPRQFMIVEPPERSTSVQMRLMKNPLDPLLKAC